jgi:hypothetical protein
MQPMVVAQTWGHRPDEEYGKKISEMMSGGLARLARNQYLRGIFDSREDPKW